MARQLIAWAEKQQEARQTGIVPEGLATGGEFPLVASRPGQASCPGHPRKTASARRRSSVSKRSVSVAAANSAVRRSKLALRADTSASALASRSGRPISPPRSIRGCSDMTCSLSAQVDSTQTDRERYSPSANGRVGSSEISDHARGPDNWLSGLRSSKRFAEIGIVPERLATTGEVPLVASRPGQTSCPGHPAEQIDVESRLHRGDAKNAALRNTRGVGGINLQVGLSCDGY